MLTSDDDNFCEKADPLSSTSIESPSLPNEEFVDIFVPKSSSSKSSNSDNGDAYRNVCMKI